MSDELVGATILGVSTRPDDAMGGPRPFVRLHVRYADGVEVNGEPEGYYEVWSDEEGNGPGDLAFLGAKPQ